MSIDVEELLATRLLVQGNGESGKSYLLRKLLKGSVALLEQVVSIQKDFVRSDDQFQAVEPDDFVAIADWRRDYAHPAQLPRVCRTDH